MNVPNRDTPLADIDPKAQALSLAVKRITDLQRQMTCRLLAMAVEIEKLTEILPGAEAKTSLKARCSLPDTELSA
ncbi:hypothetical protein DC415_11645 [Agrobacterium tumefaciens]|uniref:Uncharacterized protein n=1 Tax=Rhizobium rhizogenes TaxID=359 RepID=A0AA92C4U8_RHIRH|nr:hypothetical protein DC430_09845 [Rhizobium rhizogenes]PVE65605.1 hypothetical protein DC415_11645 [Agrobacterium tumefaciens]PVE75669.1 hypothetical protein DCP16_11645 [Sphingomonas sp. TPD3009]